MCIRVRTRVCVSVSVPVPVYNLYNVTQEHPYFLYLYPLTLNFFSLSLSRKVPDSYYMDTGFCFVFYPFLKESIPFLYFLT